MRNISKLWELAARKPLPEWCKTMSQRMLIAFLALWGIGAGLNHRTVEMEIFILEIHPVISDSGQLEELLLKPLADECPPLLLEHEIRVPARALPLEFQHQSSEKVVKGLRNSAVIIAVPAGPAPNEPIMVRSLRLNRLELPPAKKSPRQGETKEIAFG